MRSRALASALGAAVLAAGCGGGGGTVGAGISPGAPHVSTNFNATSCGVPYTVRAGASTVRSGSCAGILGRTAPQITVHRGQQFSIEIEHDIGGGLYYPVPAVTGTAVRQVSRRGPSVVYRGVSTGMAELLARGTKYCLATDPQVGTCPAVAVRVVP